MAYVTLFDSSARAGSRGPGRNRVPGAATMWKAGIVVLIAAAAGWFFFWRRPHAPPPGSAPTVAAPAHPAPSPPPAGPPASHPVQAQAPAPAPVPAPPPAAPGAEAAGDALLARGEKEAARAQYALAWRGAPADRAGLAKKMIDLNQELLFSRKPTRDAEVHVVQSGEVLVNIGKKYHIEPGCIMRVNGLKNTNIYPNDKLKMPKGTFRIEVSKIRRLLWLLYDDSTAKQYDVAIGREGHDTPAGEFTVAKKEQNPNWTMTTEDGRRVVVRFGQPGHMLGTRWMGFSEPHTDIGIHGTPKEEEGKIGQAASKGCIRMRNADVEELYDLVPVKTRVTVAD